MFITKQYLSRRTFLKGTGATLALPFLDAMIPAAAAQSVPAPVPRFTFIYTPMGALMEKWMPMTKDGAGIDFSPTLSALEPFREYVNIVSGLYNVGIQNHPPSPPMWLSGNVPGAGGDQMAAARRLATTVDQLIAQKIGQDTTFESLPVAVEDASQLIGACSIDDNCDYINTISWRNPTQPLTMEIHPRLVFEQLFGGEGNQEARDQRLRDNTSILDTLTSDIRALSGDLGAGDRSRVDEYLDSVRTVELQLVRGEQQRQEKGLEAPENIPVGMPDSFEEHAGLMFQLQALAFQGDLTRVTSFMLARELSGLSYPEIGVQEAHHPVSHHAYVAEVMEQKSRIDAFHISMLAKFVEQLRSTPEGDGNLLDTAVIMYGSGMSNSQVHDHNNLPTLLIGGGAGKLRGDRHIQTGVVASERLIPAIPHFDKMTPLTNLHVSLLNMAGIETDSFGAAENLSTGSADL